LHHLFKAKESLGGTLVTLHNVQFMNDLMADIRGAIAHEADVVQTPNPNPSSSLYGQSTPETSESGNNVVRNHRRTLAEVEDEYVHEQLRHFA